MTVGKEIRTKIKSIQSTQKITRAMEMVAASKMRKAQERMRASRPYAQKIRNVINHLAGGYPEYHHIYLEPHETKRLGYIIVATDRGLCGGLNINLFRKLINEFEAHEKNGIEVDVCLVGAKAQSFFRRLNVNIVAAVTHLGDQPSVSELVGGVKIMFDAFQDRKIDGLHLAFNEFVSTMNQKPILEQLLPIEETPEEKADKKHWDYIYEPDAQELLDQLLQRYLESEVYQAVVENLASEQASRMVAMKSASDNANELIEQFQLIYNKARQAAITQEISEIVGGAAAV